MCDSSSKYEFCVYDCINVQLYIYIYINPFLFFFYFSSLCQCVVPWGVPLCCAVGCCFVALIQIYKSPAFLELHATILNFSTLISLSLLSLLEASVNLIKTFLMINVQTSSQKR